MIGEINNTNGFLAQLRRVPALQAGRVVGSSPSRSYNNAVIRSRGDRALHFQCWGCPVRVPTCCTTGESRSSFCLVLDEYVKPKINYVVIAQLEERFIANEKAASSILVCYTDRENGIQIPSPIKGK
jgi:hypothetical protein